MKMTLLLCGKTQMAPVQSLMDEYIKRLSRWQKLDVLVLPELKGLAKLSEAEIRQREGEQILAQLKPGDYLVLLDEKGTCFRSQAWAQHLQQTFNRGPKRLIFAVGGPYGFSKEVQAQAQESLSLSPMTFSHQLVRALFLEQLYRAFSILHGAPYHHA